MFILPRISATSVLHALLWNLRSLALSLILPGIYTTQKLFYGPDFQLDVNVTCIMACVMLVCSLVARNGYVPPVERGPDIRFLGLHPMTIQ